MSRLRDALIRHVIFVVRSSPFNHSTLYPGPPKRGKRPLRESRAANSGKIAGRHDCRSCHTPDRKVVGPSYSDIARRYAAQADCGREAGSQHSTSGSGNWGNVSMTPAPEFERRAACANRWLDSFIEGRATGSTQPEQAAAKQLQVQRLIVEKQCTGLPVFVEGSDKKVAKRYFPRLSDLQPYCYRCTAQTQQRVNWRPICAASPKREQLRRISSRWPWRQRRKGHAELGRLFERRGRFNKFTDTERTQPRVGTCREATVRIRLRSAGNDLDEKALWLGNAISSYLAIGSTSIFAQGSDDLVKNGQDANQW